ncbi:YqcC family protein [Vibrio sp. JPW-9-11-11]|uniref:YqcC family protein n=1 Tax=Vibrio sp. JPW-9-11-11 TaxID=1416532 RepID=UPI001593BEEA|nr:YqcC family protein [Vibrio sp. JPW-9-11-11]NVD06093.1 YqcC family protein [Vibrio sp. JPW-9-11-11]
MTNQQQLVELIDVLEQQLRAHACWQVSPPSEQALASQQPFAVDTLAPQEWLQWIFVPRMRLLLERQQPLPSGFSMVAYFEESWKLRPELSLIVETIRKIDEVCCHA